MDNQNIQNQPSVQVPPTSPIAAQSMPATNAAASASAAPMLTSQVGYVKSLVGNIKGRAYGRDDTLSFLAGTITYTSAQDPSASFSIPLASVTKVKQRLQELWIYTNDGKNYTFEFGNPTTNIVGGVLGGVVGLGVMSHGVTASGINEWFEALKNAGITMDDSMFNNSKGMMIATVKIFVWIVLSLTSLLFVVAIIAATQGKDGGKPIVFVVEGVIIAGCVAALKFIPSGKRV